MSERIKELRKILGLTQIEFAEKLKIGRGTIANYEVGRNEPIDAVIALICQKFNVNETWLRTGAGEKFIQEPTVDLGEYARRHNMTDLETEILKAYLDLDADMRDNLLQHFKMWFAKKVASDSGGQKRTEVDIAAELAEVKRQNQELAAKVAAMEEEDAKMEAAAELSASALEYDGVSENQRIKK